MMIINFTDKEKSCVIGSLFFERRALLDMIHFKISECPEIHKRRVKDIDNVLVKLGVSL